MSLSGQNSWNFQRIFLLIKTSNCIFKKIGGAAHIDKITLGGLTPQKITSNNSLETKQSVFLLSLKDNNLLPLTPDITLTFPAGRKNNLLSLTGRIEKQVISKIPFLFPIQNGETEITINSNFYTRHYIDFLKTVLFQTITILL